MTHPGTPGAACRAAMLCLFATGLGLPARAAIEESYQPGVAPIVSTWYAAASAPAQAVDRGYLAGMRPHHVGALTMSQAYLDDPARRSPLLQALAGSIIANQRFEIGVLDTIGRDLDQPVLSLPFGIRLQAVATEGLGATSRFFRTPMPGVAASPLAPVSERDVQFAKAMIIHHQGALTMAHAYHADPARRNGFLGLMNVDIITDQSQEIALMQAVIAAYPGDAAAVRVDPAMVHGMAGMAHTAADPEPDHAAPGRMPAPAGQSGSAPGRPPRATPPHRHAAATAAPPHADHAHAH